MLVAGTLAAGLAVCWPDGDEQAQFRSAVQHAPGCASDAACTVLFTPCPLGCSHAVPVSEVDRLQALADRLAAKHATRNGACAYDCRDPGPAMCRAGRCVLARDAD